MRLITPTPARALVTRPLPASPASRPQAPATAPAPTPSAPGPLDRLSAWLRGLGQKPVRLVSGGFDPLGGGAPTITVQPGDTLSAIAQRELGDYTRWNAIFEANRDQISNPNLIWSGMVLKLPGVASAPAPAPAPTPAPAPAAATVTVQGGDTLGSIAQRTLGDSNRWREIYDANRDQIANPNVIWPGMVLKVPGGTSAPAAPAAVAASSAFGDQAVASARQLQAQGYKYTIDLGPNYRPVRFSIGCCADFAVDAWAKAGVDIYHDTTNPHYCPTLVNYFKAGTSGHQWIGANGAAKPGDMVFFDWGGDGESDHVAIVTEVDGNGRPLKIIESYDFNLPVRERYVGNSQANIIGYGRA